MNKLRFAKDEGTAFYKELKERVDAYFISNNLGKTGNKKMFFKMSLYFSLDVLFYWLMITSATPLGFYSFYLLMGISILLTAFNISHDAAHGVAVKRRYWNKVLFNISFNLQGNNAFVWGKNHTESHHLYTNVEGSDIDVLNNPLFRMTETQSLKWFHRYQYLYAPLLYMLYSINWTFIRETAMLFNYTSRTIQIKIPRVEVIKLVIYKLLYVGYMVIIPSVLLPFGWTTVLFAFLINHVIISIIFVGVLGVSHLSDFVQHPASNNDSSIDMSWPKLQLCTSVDYNANSTFFNWTLGGFNAHALHHLLPNVCHVHYPAILPIFREVAAKHGLTYMEMPYSRALAAHFRFLKAMGNCEKINTMPYAG